MSSSNERGIIETWRVQITPSRYKITGFNTYEYECVQKINANTVNLLNLSILYAFPNITNDYNQIRVKVEGVQYNVIIPEQYIDNFWSIFDMLTIVKDALNSQTGGAIWTVTLSGNQNKFVRITCNKTFVLVKSQLVYQNQIQRYFGFSNPSSVAFNTASLSHLSEFPYNVQPTSTVNVQIRGVGDIQSDSAAVMVQIPIAQVGTYVHWQSPFYQFARSIISHHHLFPINVIDVSFIDDNSRPLIIGDNQISMTLMFERFDRE